MKNGRLTNGTPSPDVFTPAEAADYLRLSRKKLDKMLQRGEIPHRRVGRSILIVRAALDEWLNIPVMHNGKNSSDPDRS
jgi:excisionase family DNA binding protein